MVSENDHSACVDAWFTRAAKGLPSEQLIDAFDQAFGALWRRAQQTLGDVTLTAIADRVLFNAAEQFPHLSTLELSVNGLRCDGLRVNAGGLHHHDRLAEGLRYVLVEFLRVLGDLTADILTPTLHAELSIVRPSSESGGEGAKP